jgi:hypothetical protein
MDLSKITISKHAKERYAERIMDKSNKTDITVFIANNEAKIKEDISKMIEFGELIYTGKPIANFNNRLVDLYLNGTWVVIVDNSNLNVITLYSIDLGLGNDYNKDYIGRLLNKLEEEKKLFAEASDSIENQVLEYEQIIEDNTAQIAEYKRIIKSLEQQNTSYKEIIGEMKTNVSIAETGVRNVVAILIGKKVF